ncbi:TPA: hypothetical protein ENX78_02510 [Candidatus Poribacteria bacterium]|nr:hypothetical protein [Candidatus Poribacteria bacterium]
MDEYSVLDKRKYPVLVVDKSIPLAYAPYIGADSVCLYLIYVSIADQGVSSFNSDEIMDFIGIDNARLDECNKKLEEYGLIKLEAHEHNGRIINTCHILQPPPIPRTLYADLQNKALVRDFIKDILIQSPAEQKQAPVKRVRTSLVTPNKIITKFYSMMGNGKLDIFEREAGKKHINDLQKKGYSIDDIDFAIEWGFEHAREQIEDFSSIADIIDKAISARDKYIYERQQQAEREAKSQENEELERKMIEAYKKMMSDAEKKALRERVMEMIKQDKRINLEFVTEQFIIIKENEIIREEYLKKKQ